MNGWQRKSIQIRHRAEAEPVPIVSDASMATSGIADGRLIPLLILDTSARPDIEDMIRAHRYLGSGDAKSAWALPSRFDKSKIRLVLTVVNPSHCVTLLDFDVVRRGCLVDQIVHVQGLYIQSGRPGDRLASTRSADRILVEVPSRQFRPEWDRIFRKGLTKNYRRRGLSRADARNAAMESIKTWRELTARRLRSEYDHSV